MTLEFLDGTSQQNEMEILAKCQSLAYKYEAANENEKEALNKLQNKLLNKKFKISPNEVFYLEKASEEIWIPYLLFRSVFNKLASDKLNTKFPLYLLIEPTSICNLRCVMCFQIDKSFGGAKSFMGRMGMDLFKSIIDQAVEGGCKAITLASRGDPTLNKNLGSMLDYMKGKFLEVKLNTNGILLSDDLSRNILRNEVTDLVFSIDSYEKENYEAIRKKGKFDKVVSKIKRFQEIRANEFPSHRTTVRVSGVKVDVAQDKSKYSEFWSRLVDHTVLVDLEERWDTYNNSILPAEKLMPCGDLFERMYIWWDGTVNPCDVDYKSTLALGNVQENTIEEIWNGDRYSMLRDKHLKGSRSDYKVCSQCDSYTC